MSFCEKLIFRTMQYFNYWTVMFAIPLLFSLSKSVTFVVNNDKVNNKQNTKKHAEAVINDKPEVWMLRGRPFAFRNESD